LVSSSLSEVWLVLRFPRSALYPTSCSAFGVGFSLYWFIGGLFLHLSPFLWGKVRDPSASSLLSACYAGLLIIFQFCSIFRLWMLLTASGDELCGLLSALFQAVAYNLHVVGLPVFSVFVYRKFPQKSAPCPVPLLWCTYSTLPFSVPWCYSAFCYYSVFYIFIHFFTGAGKSVQGGMLDYPRGSCENAACHLFAH
jgi:hypothetical protein